MILEVFANSFGEQAGDGFCGFKPCSNGEKHVCRGFNVHEINEVFPAGDVTVDGGSVEGDDVEAIDKRKWDGEDGACGEKKQEYEGVVAGPLLKGSY